MQPDAKPPNDPVEKLEVALRGVGLTRAWEDRRRLPAHVRRWLPAGCVALLIVGYLLLIPVGVIEPKNRLGTPEIILAGLLFALLVFAGQTAVDLTKLGFGAGGIVASFEARQRRIETDVEALRIAITGLVTKHEFANLSKLAADPPATVRYGEIMLSELNHLDAMDFIHPTQAAGLNAIREEHGSGLDDFDLKQYLAITRQGRQYLALRARFEAQKAVEKSGVDDMPPFGEQQDASRVPW